MKGRQVIVAVAGKKQAGKSTFAQTFVEEYGFTHVNFADPLREMLYALNPIAAGGYPLRLQNIVDEVGWDLAKETWPEVRLLMQRMGTEAGRGVLGEDVWVLAALARIDRIEGPVVISDLRFPNELTAIKRTPGGYIVRVVRPNRPTSQAGEGHASETALDGLPEYAFDATVRNVGTADDLRAEARRIAEHLLSRPGVV